MVDNLGVPPLSSPSRHSDGAFRSVAFQPNGMGLSALPPSKASSKLTIYRLLVMNCFRFTTDVGAFASGFYQRRNGGSGDGCCEKAQSCRAITKGFPVSLRRPAGAVI